MNNLQNNQKHDAAPMMYDTLFGVVVYLPKCAVKVVSSGEHCPEAGIHKIDDTDDYLCERCYENLIVKLKIEYK